MTRLLKKILIFIVFVIGPIFALDIMVTAGLKKSHLLPNCLNDVHNSKASSDILIAGSSRGLNQYSPAIFESVLGGKCFNISINGWPVHMEYCMFKLYMKYNKKPKYIIQNIGWSHLRERHDFFGYEQFIPYRRDTIVRRFTDDLEGGFSFAERYFPLFAYNNHSDLIWEGIRSFFGHGAQAPKGFYNGYLPLYNEWDTEFESWKKRSPFVFNFDQNDTAVREFRQFLTDCKNDSIKVVFVYAPTYIGATELMTNRAQMLGLYKTIAAEYNIPILDYTYDSLSYNTKYFANSQHMNNKGAEIFSRALANDLKKVIVADKPLSP